MKEKNPVSKIEDDGAFESRFIYSQILLKIESSREKAQS